MNDFLKNLRESVETGKVNQAAIDNLNKINTINKLVVEKYGGENVGEKMSMVDLSKLEQKVDDLVGERKLGINKDLFDALEAVGNNIVVNEAIKLEDNINKYMLEVSEDYYMKIESILLDEFGIKYKKFEDVIFDDIHIDDANNLLSKICLFELEYIDFLENSVYYNTKIIEIKNNLIKILKK